MPLISTTGNSREITYQATSDSTKSNLSQNTSSPSLGNHTADDVNVTSSPPLRHTTTKPIHLTVSIPSSSNTQQPGNVETHSPSHSTNLASKNTSEYPVPGANSKPSDITTNKADSSNTQTQGTANSLGTHTESSVPLAYSDQVPGWAIALLVLVCFMVLLLLILCIVLLVCWCKRWRNYGFLDMSGDPIPYGHFNHGDNIPMYSTHSRFEAPNGKPYVSQTICDQDFHHPEHVI
uniref:Mucin-1 n=1 Tax=Scleropages formosus TaxID=113540 RepID=A0A8C9VHH6_SCLFO